MKILILLSIVLETFSASVAQRRVPRTAEDYINRGLERQGKGDLDGAIEDYSKVIARKANPLVLAAAYNNPSTSR